MTEASAAAIRINNVEDIRCVRDVRDAQFKRPRSANVGIGGCASPQPNFDCKIGEKGRLAGFERLRHPALSDHVVFSGSVEAGDREADRSRGRKRRHSFGYRSARSAACVGRCYQRQSRTGRHESRQAYGGHIDCRNPKSDVSFAVSAFRQGAQGLSRGRAAR